MNPRCKDLTGRVYGNLTALHYLRSDKNGAVWQWACICGKEVEYSAHSVKRGHALSCGCQRSRNYKQSKLCSTCGMPSDGLTKHGNTRSTCKKCFNEKQAVYYRKNPVIYLLNTCKARAKKAGVPFDLVKDDILIPEYCPVLGIEFEFGTRGFHENSASIDRLNPNKGYVKGNIAIISFRANRIKCDATLEELKKLVAWLESKET